MKLPEKMKNNKNYLKPKINQTEKKNVTELYNHWKTHRKRNERKAIEKYPNTCEEWDRADNCTEWKYDHQHPLALQDDEPNEWYENV